MMKQLSQPPGTLDLAEIEKAEAQIEMEKFGANLDQ